jgi:hypothetical protein
VFVFVALVFGRLRVRVACRHPAPPPGDPLPSPRSAARELGVLGTPRNGCGRPGVSGSPPGRAEFRMPVDSYASRSVRPALGGGGFLLEFDAVPARASSSLLQLHGPSPVRYAPRVLTMSVATRDAIDLRRRMVCSRNRVEAGAPSLPDGTLISPRLTRRALLPGGGQPAPADWASQDVVLVQRLEESTPVSQRRLVGCQQRRLAPYAGPLVRRSRGDRLTASLSQKANLPCLSPRQYGSLSPSRVPGAPLTRAILPCWYRPLVEPVGSEIGRGARAAATPARASDRSRAMDVISPRAGRPAIRTSWRTRFMGAADDRHDRRSSSAGLDVLSPRRQRSGSE